MVSRDHKIYLHDDPSFPRAEGLKAALEATQYRGLTVAFPFRDESEFIRWRYAAYTRSALLWAGDDETLTVFSKEGPVQLHSGGKEYEQLIQDPRTKVSYSVYFVLAEWLDATHIELVFPDEFGVYRIRTTSKKTIDNLRTALRTVRNISGGHFAGVPFDLRLVNYQGVDRTGLKRTFPVFAFGMKARGGLRLSSGNFKAALTSGNAAAAALQLPPIRDADPQHDAPEELETEVTKVQEGAVTAAAPEEPEADYLEAEFTPVEDDALRNLETNKDPEAMKKQWFASTKGTHLYNGEARAEFLARHVDGVDSLSKVVGLLRPEQFSELLVLAQDEIAEAGKTATATATLEKTKWHASVTPFAAKVFVQAYKEAEIGRLELFPLLQMLTRKSFDGRGSIGVDDIGVFTNALGNFEDDGTWALDKKKQGEVQQKFKAWVNSDESALGVL